MKIAICEDNAAQAKLIKAYTNEWSNANSKLAEIYSYSSAESFAFSLEDDGPFDLLLLDIQMADMSGVELAKELRKQKNDVIIVFVTALKEYVFEGYDVDAIQYILKPINKEKLFLSLNKAYYMSKKSEPYIIIENKKIKQNDIIYIEAKAHYIDLYLENEIITTRYSLKDIYDKLDSSIFLFCHRSYIVNIGKIEQIQKEEIILECGFKVPISRAKYKEVNAAFIAFFTGSGEIDE